VGFGTGPLNHPLLVEAIEEQFVPVLVFNNKEGADAALLKRFAERAWNNPVVRFLDGRGAELLPRKDGVWTGGELAPRMVAALKAAKREVPAWLELAASELAAAPKRALFSMYCFWEGEAKFGALDGVVATRPGFVGEDEAVEVLYDPATVSFEKVVEAALSIKCAGTIYCADGEQLAVAARMAGERAKEGSPPLRDAPAADCKHALRASPLWLVPMTPAQQCRVNAALYDGKGGEEPTRWLSPRQREFAAILGPGCQ